MNVAVESPELGRSIIAGGYQTNLHEHGKGFPLMLIHGSGPGVTAWANWRLVMPELAKQRRVIAPDMLGFGYSERPANPDYQRDVWVEHAIGVLDALGIEQADLVGNSFGGGIALALAIRYPHRVRRLVLPVLGMLLGRAWRLAHVCPSFSNFSGFPFSSAGRAAPSDQALSIPRTTWPLR